MCFSSMQSTISNCSILHLPPEINHIPLITGIHQWTKECIHIKISNLKSFIFLCDILNLHLPTYLTVNQMNIISIFNISVSRTVEGITIYHPSLSRFERLYCIKMVVLANQPEDLLTLVLNAVSCRDTTLATTTVNYVPRQALVLSSDS